MTGKEFYNKHSVINQIDEKSTLGAVTIRDVQKHLLDLYDEADRKNNKILLLKRRGGL